MEKYKGILNTELYQFVCCSYKKYRKYASNLTEENKQKCWKIYNSLKEISPGLIDGKDITQKIEEIEKNQKFDLNIKKKKGYYLIDIKLQGLDIEIAHFEAVDLTKYGEEKIHTKNIEEIFKGKIIDRKEDQEGIHILVKVSEQDSLVIDCNGHNLLFDKEMRKERDVIYAKDDKLYVGDHNKYVKIN